MKRTQTGWHSYVYELRSGVGGESRSQNEKQKGCICWNTKRAIHEEGEDSFHNE